MDVPVVVPLLVVLVFVVLLILLLLFLLLLSLLSSPLLELSTFFSPSIAVCKSFAAYLLLPVILSFSSVLSAVSRAGF